ncbi:hypothetical protein [Paraburkholderia fynbosensis]|uniref:hypothetical protein n=1 Tax=Paraburkholderia fynbosensis TaxID=1200993 RepID=UPI0024841561|nr:hypothetical protein [Paraburkholderia fynbosensis]
MLQDGESLSNFVKQAIRNDITRRSSLREFVARGLASREEAKQSGDSDRAGGTPSARG